MRAHVDESLHRYLASLSVATLQERIRAFRRLDYQRISQEALFAAIHGLFLGDAGPGYWLPLFSVVIPASTRFYRVRKITDETPICPPENMRFIGDCWEPPGLALPMGRLNREGIPVLYACAEPLVAFEETHIADGELCSLIVYESVSHLTMVYVGTPPAQEGYSDEELTKLHIIQDFLETEFTRDVGVGTEYLYTISNRIADDLFPVIPDLHDGWVYPSVALKGHQNVCFTLEAKSKLILVGVRICSVRRHGENYMLSACCVLLPSEGDDALQIYPIGSEEQLEAFPDIRLASSASPITEQSQHANRAEG